MLAASWLCQVKERHHRECKCNTKDTNPSGCFVSPPGMMLHARAEVVCICVCVCICARACKSVSICAMQAKTNVLLHSSFAFKILYLVPLVWLLEHISPKTTTKLSLSLKWTVCGCRGDLGVGFTVAFLFTFVGLALQRPYERCVCHPDDEEHIT